MVIAAGQGAIAAQSINRDLFEDSLATRSLTLLRRAELRTLPARRFSRTIHRKKPHSSTAFPA
jgi:hypothetical protein